MFLAGIKRRGFAFVRSNVNADDVHVVVFILTPVGSSYLIIIYLLPPCRFLHLACKNWTVIVTSGGGGRIGGHAQEEDGGGRAGASLLKV